MPLFRRKKVGRPKNPLGYALYEYDNIVSKDLKRIISNMLAKREMNPGKVSIVLEGVFSKFDRILDDISKENLKIDYRSDKTRYIIISMINKLRSFFEKAKTYNFSPLKMEEDKNNYKLSEIIDIREDLKNKMKDIESDYL